MYVFVCRDGAAQKLNDIVLHVKKDVKASPECMAAIANITVKLLLYADDSMKVTKPLMQVSYTTALTGKPQHMNMQNDEDVCHGLDTIKQI